MIFDGPDELTRAVGIRLGPTQWRVIDQESVVQFGRLTDDMQWIHTDPERAARSLFGGTIVHGFFTLALCSSILDELQTTIGFSHGLNYGLNRVRFPAPLRTGTAVTGSAELLTVDGRDAGIQAVWRIALYGQGNERPVCVADMVSQYVL
ncbi:MaoC family dehydratase [Rhodococcus globerulus]|uniref:MaoC family dehydratase n=1 Tax=Rhodococcus globerulus TaxID=33008 RepID=UPI000526E115|nr:MaoC family dehydratase [Rhodococcus globerulus]